jgi:tetratricopeptide (TPR) repeat protein
MLNHIFEKAKRAQQLWGDCEFEASKQLALEIEAESTNLDDIFERAVCLKYAAGLLIDNGGSLSDENMVERGVFYFKDWCEKHASEDDKPLDFYNLANGYSVLWEFRSHLFVNSKKAEDAEEHRLARYYYRKSLEALKELSKDELDNVKSLACQIWTNYGNSLDNVGRSIEAIDAYDEALRINPNMGMALGNKGRALFQLAYSMTGYRHQFYIVEKTITKILTAALNSICKKHFSRSSRRNRRHLSGTWRDECRECGRNCTNH